MHSFHEYLSKQLCGHLGSRHVVVWYDPREEFRPYIRELRGGADAEACELEDVQIGDSSVHLCTSRGSLFEVRLVVEPVVAADRPGPLVIYLPGVERDRLGSVLMELEKGGACYEPQLKRLARNVLRECYTDGDIDEMLSPNTVTYQDIVGLLEQVDDRRRASMLKLVFAGCSTSTAILAAWLADSSRDAAITEKQAAPELYKLVAARLGIEIEPGTGLAAARAKVARYVLVNEFRSDLQGEPPASAAMIPDPPSADDLERIRDVAATVRKDHPDTYATLADDAESGLGLSAASLEAANLGAVDTFRFEERSLLRHCGQLIAEGKCAEAMECIEERRRSFWVDRDVGRQAQWEACWLMAELSLQVQKIRPDLEQMGEDPRAWVDAYAAQNGWHQADGVYRTLAAHVSRMDEELECPEALGRISKAYDELLRQMAERFTSALKQSAWAVPGVLHQTRVYSDLVEPSGGRVAYLLVDSMRFEMGADLAQRLSEAKDLALQPAVAALPTITPVGMAALLPAASSSFSVVSREGSVAARVEDSVMASHQARRRFLRARVPDAVDITLGKVLHSTGSGLRKAIGDASLVVVRSQDIDAVGENADNWVARQIMDSLIGNIARAIRKLSVAGIKRFVVSADHGHQFSEQRLEHMKTDSPGGKTLAMHRRCWIGQGGQTPPGTVRVTGAELGYDTDLDFVFPIGLGVFPAQGDLSYHHGGISLQEILVPVLSFRLPAPVQEAEPAAQVVLSGCPETVTNRTFGVKVMVPKTLFAKGTVPLRVVLLAGGEQVGEAGMAIDAELDRDAGCVRFEPGKEASLAMLLTREDCETAQVVVQDPETDAVLAQSIKMPVKLGI
ncbi:PglZ domain-containing protein [Planctomycetota bacterium]